MIRRVLATCGVLLVLASAPILLGLMVVTGTLVHTHTDGASGGATLNPTTILSPSGSSLVVGSAGANALTFATSSVARWTIDPTVFGLGPSGNKTQSLGGGSNNLLSVFAERSVYSGVAFASLPTFQNGIVLYCTDCTIANPCAGGGTGAIAKRLNGISVCN